MSSRQENASMSANFDYIVVGAGSAGCVLAARLTENRETRVALVEAGGSTLPPEVADPAKWPLLQGSAIDWRWRTAGQGNCASRQHDWPRGRGVGGSSALNAMAHVRGHPSDFDSWARQGACGWGFADLLPYFVKSETSPFKASAWHGSDGPIHLIVPDSPHPITEAYMAAGAEQGLQAIDEHNARHLAGPTLNTLTIKNGKRQTVADAYLTADVLTRPNFSLLTDCLVDRLLIDSNHCRRVRLNHAGAWKSLAAESGVVLCAGTVGSAVILQRSGIGDPGHLRSLGIVVTHSLPWVGENLQDHLLAGGNVYRAKRPVPTSHYQHSESLTYIHLPDGSEAPDVVVACVLVPVTTECFDPVPMGEAYTLMYGTTHPRSRGSVRITSADPNTAPRIDPQYLSDPYDRRTTLQALDWARRLGQSAALSDWRAEELLPTRGDLASTPTREAFMERAAHTHHHPVGTCKMGVDEQSVVDPELKVHGLEGLYVVDASIMPSLPTGPINAAIVAMAEKAADKLKGATELPAMDPSAVS